MVGQSYPKDGIPRSTLLGGIAFVYWLRAVWFENMELVSTEWSSASTQVQLVCHHEEAVDVGAQHGDVVEAPASPAEDA